MSRVPRAPRRRGRRGLRRFGGWLGAGALRGRPGAPLARRARPSPPALPDFFSSSASCWFFSSSSFCRSATFFSRSSPWIAPPSAHARARQRHQRELRRPAGFRRVRLGQAHLVLAAPGAPASGLPSILPVTARPGSRGLGARGRGGETAAIVSHSLRWAGPGGLPLPRRRWHSSSVVGMFRCGPRAPG